MTTHPGLPTRDVQASPVPSAELPSEATVARFMAALHDSFLQDEEIDDAVDTVLGWESALLTPEELEPLLPRLRTHLRQLVGIAIQRTAGGWSVELADLVLHTHLLDTEPEPDDFPAARGHARRLALATEEVLAHLDSTQDAAEPNWRWSV